MTRALWLLASFGSAYLGFACLALSQQRHWQAILGTEKPKGTRLMRALGSLLLAASLAAALARDGASFGSLLWVTLLSSAALAVALTLAFWPPRLTRTSGRIAQP